jgi:hypothetical protein
MKFRGLLAAVVVLAALGGLLWWSQRHKPSSTPAEPALPAILKVDAKSVTSLTLRDKGAQPIVLTPISPQLWRITAPVSFRADNESVEQMVGDLAALVPQRVVDDKVSSLATYGLSDPSVAVDIAETNHQSAHFLLGDKTPTGDAVYAMIPGNPRVYTVALWVQNTFGKSLQDLEDKHLIPVHTPDVKQVEILRKGEDIAIARVPGGWQMQKPDAWRTNNYEVDNLVDQIVSATWSTSGNASQTAGDFSHGTPVATVKVTTGTGTQAQTDSLEIRKSKDNYYAQSSAVPGTWNVDSSLATALDRSADTYRNKQLFNFGYSEPAGIQYRSGTVSLDLMHSGSDWLANGRKMDPDSVEAVVTALRSLAASKFVDSGYTQPDIDLTVVSDGGRQVEKVHFQKTPQGAIGKRDDGPGLYFVDSTTMNGLTSALAGVKPAAPGPAKK